MNYTYLHDKLMNVSSPNTPLKVKKTELQNVMETVVRDEPNEEFRLRAAATKATLDVPAIVQDENWMYQWVNNEINAFLDFFANKIPQPMEIDGGRRHRRGKKSRKPKKSRRYTRRR